MLSSSPLSCILYHSVFKWSAKSRPSQLEFVVFENMLWLRWRRLSTNSCRPIWLFPQIFLNMLRSLYLFEFLFTAIKLVLVSGMHFSEDANCFVEVFLEFPLFTVLAVVLVSFLTFCFFIWFDLKYLEIICLAIILGDWLWVFLSVPCFIFLNSCTIFVIIEPLKVLLLLFVFNSSVSWVGSLNWLLHNIVQFLIILNMLALKEKVSNVIIKFIIDAQQSSSEGILILSKYQFRYCVPACFGKSRGALVQIKFFKLHVFLNYFRLIIWG